MATAELFGIEGYGPPATGQGLVVTARDGVGLRAARWRPTSRKALEARGTVLVIAGRAEFFERYYETVQALRRRGFHVASFDWRGQGGSDRLAGNPRKGHVRRFRDYRFDLDAIFGEVMATLPRPWFVLAHSMGAAICLDAARAGLLPVDRLVALSPMLGIRLIKNPRGARVLGETLNALGLGRSFVPSGSETAISTKPFAGNRLTSDPVRYARNALLASTHPQLAIGDPSVRWVVEALRFMERMAHPAAALDIRVPTMVIAAGDDEVVSVRVTERFAARLKTGMAIILPQSRHEILNEVDAVRDAFWAAFDAFIPGELASSAGKASAVQQGEGGVMDTPVP
jgi:lysophospholipase